MSTWEIEVTDTFRDWYRALDDDDRDAVTDRVDFLAQHGPNAKRPVVGEITGSKNDPQMKELRVGQAAAIRILFIFDPRRTAILLLGGTKKGQWKAWYREAIAEADRLYDEYLTELREEGLL